MAYMREGFILVRGSGRELIIDELDEDAVEIETAEDTSSNWLLTKIQTQTVLGSPVSQHIWSSDWEEGSQAAHPLPG